MISANYRVLHIVPLMVFGMLLCFATDVFADTIYLKDGTILRGTIKSENEKTVLIEMVNTWKHIYRSNIEYINRDTVPAETQAETKVQAQQSSAATSRTVTDLRLKFGSSSKVDEVSAPGSTVTFNGTDSSNVQIEVNVGMYGQSNVGLILSAGLFARTHSGNENAPSITTTIDYKAAGLSLGAGIGIKASDHLHFEGKLELGMGSGDGTLSTPGVVWNETEAAGYGSISLILGAYYTVSKPGFQIGLELGTQSFSGEFNIRNNFGGWATLTVEGSSSTANLVVGMRF